MFRSLSSRFFVVCITTALCSVISIQASAQKSRPAFDIELQRKAMREFAGPDALCREVKDTRRCQFKNERLELYVRGDDYELFARVYLKDPELEESKSAIGRLLALPPIFGFETTATHECLKKAFEVSIADRTTGNVKVGNAEYEMTCRANAPADLIFDLSTKVPTPKSDF